CRLPRGPFPWDLILALVRDADGGERAAVDAGRVERLLRDRARHVPDLAGVVLHPAGAREVLAELAVGAPHWPAGLVERDAGGAGGALVEGEDQAGGSLSRRYLPGPCLTSK